MTRPELVVDDVVHRIEGSQLTVRAGDQQANFVLAAVGQVVVDMAVTLVAERLAVGESLAAAVELATRTLSDVPGHTARRLLPNGAVLLDDTAASTALDVRASLRVLADLARNRARSFAVLGELETMPADWFDDHDALGRIIVRLDISQLIVVGDGARHIHNAAGLEGSWDGESMLVDTVEQAYDVVRAQVDKDDVILVSAASCTPLARMVSWLQEADR